MHRRDTDPAVTDSTMFSVTSSSNHNHTITTAAQNDESNIGSSSGGVGGQNKQKGKSSRRNNNKTDKQQKKKKSSRGGFLKLPMNVNGITSRLLRRKKGPLTEAKLRKKVKKSAERGDWDSVSKLISSHEFSDRPETMPKQGSVNPSVIVEEPAPVAGRRPSYGSRGGRQGSFTRNSLTRKESAAVAAAIRAAALEESSDDAEFVQNDATGGSSAIVPVEHCPDIGENILHDICQFCPPLDVLETLLVALRHRRGCLRGTDDCGRTPLHLAALSGARPEIIDALVRSDPAPASMGDDDLRSPMHLAMKCLVYPQTLPHHHGMGGNKQQYSPQEPNSPEEMLEMTYRTVRILKDAMLTYPGKVDFKHEDKTGYSPLDYAIDGNIHIKEGKMIQCLIRRKEPRSCRSIHRAHGIPSRPPGRCCDSVASARSYGNRSRSGYCSAASSGTEDQDLDILLELEQDEIAARRHRVEKMKAKREEAKISDALFDVFGIEEQPKLVLPPPMPTITAPLKTPEDDNDYESLSKSGEEEGEGAVEKELQPPRATRKPSITKSMKEDMVYNQHLEDYLNDYLDDDFDGDLEDYVDEGGFDLYHDPEEDESPEIVRDAVPDAIFVDQDDCMSVVSEVTAPLPKNKSLEMSNRF